ncbi:MAG: hypothetical protein ACK5FS_15960 [Planctomycetota bacterium]
MKNCPTQRPHVAPQVPSDAVELLSIWSRLTGDQKGELIVMARALVDQDATLEA